MLNTQMASHSYRTNQINGASPLELVLMAYDAALTGCAQRDLERTARALALLRNALEFSYQPEMALGLFKLYQYCADLARQGAYGEAAGILRELRGTWAQLLEQAKRSPAGAVGEQQPAAVAIPAEVVLSA